MKSFLRLLTLGSTLLLVSAAPALATPTWTLQSVPEPSGGTQSSLSAVSCPSATTCTAVGGYDKKVWGALAEEWNGKTWGAGSAVANPGNKNGNLASISCASTTECVATGSYGTPSGATPLSLAESKENTTWAQQTTKNPSASANYLLGVSCWTTALCTSVGQDQATHWGALGESWTGFAWAEMFSLLNPGSGSNASLLAISCVSSSRCMSVGYWNNAKAPWSEVVYTGSSEKREFLSMVNPAEATETVFEGISCLAENACFADGYYKHGGLDSPLIEHWGSAWSMESAATPVGASEAVLRAMSCVSTTSCEAVGWYVSAGKRQTLAESWNGSKWEIQSTPNPAEANLSELRGVSCSAEGVCTAVGEYFTTLGVEKALAERLE